jgi:hypothetical protein
MLYHEATDCYSANKIRLSPTSVIILQFVEEYTIHYDRGHIKLWNVGKMC